MAKKELPRMDASNINTDFFKDSIDLQPLTQGLGHIAALQTAQDYLPEPEFEKENMIVPEDKEENLTTSEFISLLKDGKDRRNTRPVRISTKNCDRILKLRQAAGGNRTLPELVDWILDEYLTIVERDFEL